MTKEQEEKPVKTLPVSDLKVIITGGSGGLGAATATLLAEGGAQVVICDIRDDEGAALADKLGDKVHYRHLDVTRPEDWSAAIKAAESAFGGVNALFNNAGIVSFTPIQESSPEEFRKTIDINLYGVFLGIHLCAPAMARAGGGAIVNTSSTAGMMGYAGIASYVASKWGVRGLTKAAALDLAGEKIRVCSIHPGPIRTNMTAGLSEDMPAAQPIPRFGEPEEVARLVRFLMCEATYSTGGEFLIDGGVITGQQAIQQAD